MQYFDTNSFITITDIKLVIIMAITSRVNLPTYEAIEEVVEQAKIHWNKVLEVTFDRTSISRFTNLG